MAAEGRADSIAHIFIPTSSLCPAPALTAAQYVLTLHHFTPVHQWMKSVKVTFMALQIFAK